MAVMTRGVRGVEASLIGVAIAFFTLAGSQGEPRPLTLFFLVLIAPVVLLATGFTRRAWIAAIYLLILGVVARWLIVDRGLGSDVLPVTEAAIDRLLGGGNPYGEIYVAPPGSGNAFAYPPGHLFYYLPGFLVDNMRAMEVFSTGLVLAGLALVAWLIRDDWPVATMGLYAVAPPLILLATDGSSDTSAGALLFVSALSLLIACRLSSGWLLVVAGLLAGEALAFKQHILPFWPLMLAFVASRPWRLSLPLLTRGRTVPAWLLYGAVTVTYVGSVCLPFFIASPSAFLDDVVFVSRFSRVDLGIDGWNIWWFLLRWQGFNADEQLGDLLVPIDLGVMVAAVLAGLVLGVKRPSRALLFGALAWFLVMLFARWTTYASFASVAPIVLLIPFADRLIEAPVERREEEAAPVRGPEALVLRGGRLKN